MAKMNPIFHLQKWMDTFAGQTFMQYAYSWGAAIVILGTLFKLTHIPGANLMLFIGMGTEVFVFFIAGFERVTEKVPDHPQQQNTAAQGDVIAGNAPIIIGAGIMPTPTQEEETACIRTEGSMAESESEVSLSEVDIPSRITSQSDTSDTTIKSATVDAASLANLANMATQSALNTAAIQATDPTAIEEAVKGYAEELTQLTEVLGRVKMQAERMSTDSEEMENLNRTLTGIATVYELQLRNISKQVSTIEQIDEQTKRMAKQIEELNNVYARMIAALTVNMGSSMPPTSKQ